MNNTYHSKPRTVQAFRIDRNTLDEAAKFSGYSKHSIMEVSGGKVWVRFTGEDLPLDVIEGDWLVSRDGVVKVMANGLFESLYDKA